MASGHVGPAASGAGPGSGDMRSLILRAWLEPGAPPRLRTRVVEIGPGHDEQLVLITASINEACRTVRGWLEALQAQGINGNGDGSVTRGG